MLSNRFLRYVILLCLLRTNTFNFFTNAKVTNMADEKESFNTIGNKNQNFESFKTKPNNLSNQTFLRRSEETTFFKIVTSDEQSTTTAITHAFDVNNTGLSILDNVSKVADVRKTNVQSGSKENVVCSKNDPSWICESNSIKHGTEGQDTTTHTESRVSTNEPNSPTNGTNARKMSTGTAANSTINGTEAHSSSTESNSKTDETDPSTSTWCGGCLNRNGTLTNNTNYSKNTGQSSMDNVTYSDCSVKENISSLASCNKSDDDVSSSNSSRSKNQKQHSVMDYVQFIFIPLFVVVGVVGNILIIIVMRSPSFQQHPYSLVLIWMAVSAIVVLLTQPFNMAVFISLVGTDVRAKTNIGCKSFYVIWRLAKMASSWLTVYIAFQRFLAVLFPLRFKLVCSVKITRLVILCLYSVLLALTIGMSVVTKVEPGPSCIPNVAEPNLWAISKVFLITAALITSFIPITILLILIIPTIWQMYRNRAFRKTTSSTTQPINDRTNQSTIMLISVSVTFLVLVSPGCVSHNIAFLKGENMFTSQDPSTMLFRKITHLLEELNHCINIFLYWTFNLAFRSRLFALLGCLRSSVKNPRHFNITDISDRTISGLRI